MPMRKDILIWLAITNPTMLNIEMLAMRFVQEVRIRALTEPIRALRDAVKPIAVPHLFVRTAAVNVWVATL